MMPNMQSTFTGFELAMMFKVVAKTIVDHDLVESSAVIPALYFEGVIEPLKDRELLIKSEGQRKFKHWTLFTDLGGLAVDTIIQDPYNQTYRIMTSTDWSQAGYYKYTLEQGVGLDQVND